MSATTTDRRGTSGFVAEALRRPIREAVSEGVEEALREQQATTRPRGADRSDEGGGRNWGRLLVLALIGVGLAYVAKQRRGGSGGLDQMTDEIRDRSKTATTPAQPDVGGGESVETMEESLERSEQEGEGAAEGATPGAGSEDD